MSLRAAGVALMFMAGCTPFGASGADEDPLPMTQNPTRSPEPTEGAIPNGSSPGAVDAGAEDEVLLGVGAVHACAVHRAGALRCWEEAPTERVAVPEGRYRFARPALSPTQTCALREDGTIACWGPGKRTPPAGKFQRISAGSNEDMCAIRDHGDGRTDGEITCWGPTASIRGGRPGRFADVAVGDTDACGARADGSVDCWGNLRLDAVLPPLADYVQVSTGKAGRCGVGRDGRLSCWNAFTAILAKVPTGTFAWVGTTGGASICALRVAGEVACWGDAGDDVVVEAPRDRFRHLATGFGAACGVRASDGTIVCWGSDAIPSPL